ncbi:hypothetical protein OHC33_000692 [Knufia fluminis]|uniref:Zn(2)-C6 fungal-type domain-containing protein n=1 Tax=Knufia fluminis TaxID=191047 RepID=A0AAN8EN21_9EURO|nr:hypothetical protein OHC33_000692 [Knufia fluminis]
MAKESIEALLHPSLKVSRPVAACSRCRSNKVKCDGKLPACSACERAGKPRECSSANDDFARGKERSYVAALETAVQRLQRKIDDNKMEGFISRRDSLIMLAHGRPALQRRAVSSIRRKEAGSVDELVSDFGFLTVNATSRDFQGFSSTMSFAKMLKAISLQKDLPVFTDTALPPRYSISSLIDDYFENVHVLLPYLSETDFLASVSRIYQEPPTGGVSSFDIWSFRLILAISSASLCRNKGDEHYNAAVYNLSLAMNVIEHVIHPGSIAGIQALLLLVQYSLVDPEHFDSWYLVGMAARLVVDLGLHCEPAAETKLPKQVLDLRRRIFYCTYALDRLISMSLGLAFSFTDDSAPNVLLPTLATDQEARSPTQLFLRSVRPSLFLFDIRRVQSAFYQRTTFSAREKWTLNDAGAYASSTLDDIRAWHSTLPPHFSQKRLQAFYLEYLYTQALAVSPNQVVPVTSIRDAHKLLFFQCAIQFSEQLRSMVQNAELRTCLCYADFCRARYVSRQFQSIMWAGINLLVRGRQTNGSSVNATSPLANCNGALLFLGNMSQILEWPKQRWGIGALQETFERESAVLLARLTTIQQEYSASQMPATSSFAPPPQPHNSATSRPGPQHVDLSQPLQMNYSPPRGYDSRYGYTAESVNDAAPYANPAMHHSNLSRGTWDERTEQSNSELPPGTLPRRSYHFTGGQG